MLKLLARVLSCAVLVGLPCAGWEAAVAGTVSYTFDELGRLTCSLHPNGTTIAFSYDAAGNRTQQNIVAPPCSSLVRPVVYPASASVAVNSANNAVSLNIAGGIPTSVAVSTQASHGTATASGTSITYTPNSGYVNTDSFQYTATNSAGTSAPASVSVTVNQQPPVAHDVSAAVSVNAINYPITLNITGGTASSVSVSSQPSHGSAAPTINLSILYTPAPGYTGADSLQYTATGSGTSAPATVTITVSGTSTHVTPAPSWSNILQTGITGTVSGSNSARSITGVTQAINLQLNTVNPSGGITTFKYTKNGGAWTTWASGGTLTVVNNDTLAFQVSRTTDGESQGSIQVVNQSDANAVVGQFTYDVIRGNQ